MRAPSELRHNAVANVPYQVPYSYRHLTHERGLSILRDPHQVVLAIPDRVAAFLGVLHPARLRLLPWRVRRLKARGLRIPKLGL